MDLSFERPQVIAKRRARGWTVVVMCNGPTSPMSLETLRDPTLVKEVCRMAGVNGGKKYGYGSIPINTIFSGMNIHKSQL